MSNDKYGSMFDDEELGSTIPPVNDSGPKQTPIADPGLLNDEARELIEAKTKAAVETSKQAAKAGLAATVRATKQLVEKARETKTRVQANPS
ncbi:MAG: hypothetical protein ACRER5_20665, partial [Pseudomonas sp.]